MKKLITVSLLGIIGLFTLVGCGASEINYEGELRDIREVEEIIADKLEVENPSLDLEVSISEEVE